MPNTRIFNANLKAGTVHVSRIFLGEKSLGWPGQKKISVHEPVFGIHEYIFVDKALKQCIGNI